MLTDLQIRDSFIKENDIHNNLYTFKTKIDNDITSCENAIERKKVTASYKQKIFVKLNTIFRRQIILNTEEAIGFYTRNIDVLYERIEIFFGILDYIGDNLDIDFIPDRLMLCAYFRIDADTFDILLNDARADITDSVRACFKNIEEFTLSLTTNAIENGLINQSAWKRLSLKARFGGNEVESVNDSFVKGRGTVLLSSSEEVEKRLGTSYNFKELEIEKKEG